MKTLKDVKVGETATVARLHGEGPVKRRIMDMGITKDVYKRQTPSVSGWMSSILTASVWTLPTCWTSIS